ncbi:MAG: inhibitor of cysteine peptidase [Patescibacteria group bacterium]|nr:inhibitor of cysteine peptidase [Patescibacteria group bacterium]
MSKLMLVIIGSIALIILCVAIFSAPNIKNNSKPILVISVNDLSKFSVSKGQQFQIELAANPTTGFTWQLNDIYDHTTVRYISNQFTPATNNMGSPGLDVWTFEALRPGITDLQFSYSQSWDTTTPPAESKTYNINVSN